MTQNIDIRTEDGNVTAAVVGAPGSTPAQLLPSGSGTGTIAAMPGNVLTPDLPLTVPPGPGAFALLSLTSVVVKDAAPGNIQVSLLVDGAAAFAPLPFAMLASATLTIPMVFKTAAKLAPGPHTFNASFTPSAGSGTVEGQLMVQLVGA